MLINYYSSFVLATFSCACFSNLARLEKEPAKEETKKVSRPRKARAKKSKPQSDLEKYEKRYIARLEKQAQGEAVSTDEE